MRKQLRRANADDPESMRALAREMIRHGYMGDVVERGAVNAVVATDLIRLAAAVFESGFPALAEMHAELAVRVAAYGRDDDAHIAQWCVSCRDVAAREFARLEGEQWRRYTLENRMVAPGVVGPRPEVFEVDAHTRVDPDP